jgi:hypothetical protein
MKDQEERSERPWEIYGYRTGFLFFHHHQYHPIIIIVEEGAEDSARAKAKEHLIANKHARTHRLGQKASDRENGKREVDCSG